MMATEVNQTFFAWSQGETSEMGVPQGVPVSQALNHGSISFGRFEVESLSWEKWSVFTNDSRSEEFGKFNGLVAQKKAYFEEYYKRIRELKASQQQIQQTELTLEYSGDGSDSSQTGEELPADDLETPTGSGTTVYDYMEEATHETTSEQGMQCYHEHEDEDFHMEFSSSNLVSAAGISQQTNKDTENARGVNSDSVDTENGSFGHAGLGAAYENAEVPKRVIEKDPRLKYASMIIPKSVKTISGSPLEHTSVSKRPALVKPSRTLNQKTKTDNVRSGNVTPQKTKAFCRCSLCCFLQQKKLSRIQVSGDPPHHLRECPLWESGTRSPGRVLRSLLRSPPHDDLPLPKDALPPENVHRSNPLSPRNADLLLLKDALSAEGMQQSLLILQLHADRLQEKDALLPGIVFRKWIQERLARQDHLWLIQWLQQPQ